MNTKKHARIWSLIRANRQAMLYILVINVLLLIPATLAPIFKQVFADDVLAAGATDWFPILFGLMLGTALLSGVCTWLQKSCVMRLSNRIEIPRTAGYMWRLFHAPLSLLAGKDSAVLLSQAGASAGVSKVLTQDILSLIFSVISVVFYLVMMLQMDLLMSGIVVGLILLSFGLGKLRVFLSGKFAKKTGGPGAGALAFEDERISSEGLQNIETYKSTASETFFFQRILGSKHALTNARRASDYAAAYAPINSLPQVLFLNLLLLISAMRIMNRTFSIGSYLAFQAYAVAFFGPFNAVIAARGMLSAADKKLQGLFSMLDREKVDTGAPQRPADGRTKLSGEVICDHVTFAYEGCDAPVIEDFCLAVKPGQRVAIVGKSGAGKTTLVKLLQGLYAPQAGSVTMDGIAPDRLEQALKLNSIGVANQQVTLFTASVRHNINLWDDSLTQADIYRAAGDAFLHDDIAALERGYHYKVAEYGNNFSGGQRQKIELARAFLYEPSILILDEATSSIDRKTREAIERKIAGRGCTCIAVTHLIRHIVDYDEIIVLENGRVTHRGTHEALLGSSPYYAAVYKAEQGAMLS